ncbi:MAG TPA: hypothetical protein PLE44_01330 [Bacilli bacterium]|nr:hypothetical protein [Bacilli bacterium]
MRKKPYHLAHYYVLATKEIIFKDELNIIDNVIKFIPVGDEFICPNELDASLYYYYITINDSVDIALGYNLSNESLFFTKKTDKKIMEKLIKFIVDQTLVSKDVYVFFYVIPTLKPYTKKRGFFDNKMVYESLDFLLPEDSFYIDRSTLYKFTYNKYNVTNE